MLTHTLPFFFVLLLFASTVTTTAQPYNATDLFFIDCGSSSSTTTSNPRWDGDQNSNFVPSNIITTSFLSKPYDLSTPVPQTPFSSARVFSTFSFTYKFPVSEGPKFLRLYFNPANNFGLNPNQSYFSVSSNGFSLLTNFSAFLTASFLTKIHLDAGGNGQVLNFVKEFLIYVKDTEFLNVTFTPEANSYAFINGIEIVSMPEDLYYNSNNLKFVGITNGPVITDEVALENMYRLNMGGSHIDGIQDTGMHRSWDRDDDYIFGAAFGLTPSYDQLKPITYTTQTPNYIAPEQVYRTQRSMGKLSDKYNLTWILPVDFGFYYKVRLHFCNIIPQYTKPGQVVFKIFINNQAAEDEIDLFNLTQDSGYPVFKDYVVFVNDIDGSRGMQDLWVAMHPNPNSEPYHDAYLNGLEAFKLSMDRSLASANPELSFTTTMTVQTTNGKRKKKKKKPPYALIIGCTGGGLVLLSILGLHVYKVVLLFKISYSSTSNKTKR